MKIGSHEIGTGRCYVVAEIGINHGGDLETALQMVRVAARNGADAIKVQLFSASCFLPAEDGPEWKGESQREMFKRYALDGDAVKTIADECRRVGVDFFGTPDCVMHARQLVDAGAVALKIGSDDLTDTPLIRELAKMGLPLILSTGMGTGQECDAAVHAIAEARTLSSYSAALDILWLHCVSVYPATSGNLRRMEAIRRWFDPDRDFDDEALIGYSDHTDGIMAAVISVAMGACLVETHFTLDRTAEGPDHSFSKDPAQFAEMVRQIRLVETMMGTGEIDPSPEEWAMRAVARRSIVAARSTPRGTVLNVEHLAYKRTGKEGLRPSDNGLVIGKRLKRDVAADEMILEADVE